MKAVFLDRDGTVTVGIPTIQRVDSIDKVRLLPNSLAALKLLATMEYGVFFVTNQAGIAEGLITLHEFWAINDRVLQLIKQTGIKILKTYVCPHGEHDNCNCHKPEPTLLLEAAAEYDIDMATSWTIGDRPSDVMAGINAGTKAILVQTGDPSASSNDATATMPSLLEAVQYINQ